MKRSLLNFLLAVPLFLTACSAENGETSAPPAPTASPPVLGSQGETSPDVRGVLTDPSAPAAVPDPSELSPDAR